MSDRTPFVEPLPARPNLEMQQKRAKELLRKLWAGDAEAIERFRGLHPHPPQPGEAKLADAQLVIARGYGFRDWMAMKTKIESLTKSPYERFVAAVKRGDVEATRQLLAQQEEVRARVDEPIADHFDAPPVHLAKTNLPLLDVLLAHGANLNARTKWWAGGFGVLEWDCTAEQAKALIERGAVVDAWAAAHLGMLDRLRELLNAGPSLVNGRGGDGKAPLHCAVTPAIVDLLVDRGADLVMRDIDHESTPLQYRIDKPQVARRLIERGAQADIFAAVALGDETLVRQCLARDPACVTHRLGTPPWVTTQSKGGCIYNWTLGHDLSVLDVALRKGHAAIHRLLLEHAPPRTRFCDALWRGDDGAARAELAKHPGLMGELTDDDKRMLPLAAWWHNPPAAKLMLEVGFDPHVTGVHNSTALDRAAFHGYADIIAMLLQHDPHPPVAFKNEFGGTPLGCCVHAWAGGWSWDTGHPKDYPRSVELLVQAGSTLDPTWLPTGSDEVDAFLRERLRARM
ncbi:MAG: hypothetical protein WD042_15770 [Phycisphaeraceae bacterium]